MWEWTEDCYHVSYTGAPRNGTAWVSRDCGSRVLRGGSWGNEPWDLRSADRDWGTTGNLSSLHVGFRVSRTTF